jgi:hypothetical protein
MTELTKFDKLRDDYMMPMLMSILNDRLPLSKTWNNVAVSMTNDKITIEWNTPKSEYSGPFHSVVIPNSFKGLQNEINSQYYKLSRKQ